MHHPQKCHLYRNFNSFTELRLIMPKSMQLRTIPPRKDYNKCAMNLMYNEHLFVKLWSFVAKSARKEQFYA